MPEDCGDAPRRASGGWTRRAARQPLLGYRVVRGCAARALLVDATDHEGTQRVGDALGLAFLVGRVEASGERCVLGDEVRHAMRRGMLALYNGGIRGDGDHVALARLVLAGAVVGR